MLKQVLRSRLTHLLLWLSLAVVFVPQLTGYRLSPELFTGEWRTFRSSRYGYELDYPANWRLYPGDIRGHSDRILQLLNGFNHNGYIYIEYTELPGSSLEEVIIWRRSDFCIRFSVFCHGDDDPWPLENRVSGNHSYPGVSFDFISRQGTRSFHRETYILEGDRVYVIGISAKSNAALFELQGFYQNIIDSLAITWLNSPAFI